MTPGVKWLLTAFLIVIVITAAAHHYWRQYGPDLLDRRSKEFAGSSAVNCGAAQIGANPKSMTDCALAAQQAGRPFRVRYNIQGIDSQVAIAIVRTPLGKVIALSYDSDIAGGGGRGHEVVGTADCPQPIHLWVNPKGRINCFQQQLSPRKDVMSPNSEPY